jgi:hypothetical protein
MKRQAQPVVLTGERRNKTDELQQGRLAVLMADPLLAPFAMMFNAGWSALAVRRTTSAGVTYELLAPQRVRILSLRSGVVPIRNNLQREAIQSPRRGLWIARAVGAKLAMTSHFIARNCIDHCSQLYRSLLAT